MTFQVKICGIRDAGTLEVACASGADLVGFVFYPPSPRALDIFAAAELAASVPDHVGTVGLLVDPDERTLDGLLAHVSLDILQLHGDETPERIALIREHTGCRVMKALRIREKADLELAVAYASVADLLMLDAKPPIGAVLPGGNGVVFDWALAAGFRPGRPWALAGGLTADNLAAAVAATAADIYDVSSGVESAPGVKDPEKVRAFLAKAAELRRAHPEK
jgi:phosphoribosylanthranilate isomerase